MAAYLDDLYAVNQVMNLTRVRREEAETRHLIDSLLLSRFLGDASTVLDIGTGPGLPAFPIACAFPHLEVTALDSSGKMIGFLNRHPLPNLVVVQGRAEERGWRETFDIVTGRALAPFPLQIELSAAFLKLGGRFVPFRTPAERQEIETIHVLGLGLALRELTEIELPGTDIRRLFPTFEKIRPTPPQYPRAWAQMKARPWPIQR